MEENNKIVQCKECLCNVFMATNDGNCGVMTKLFSNKEDFSLMVEALTTPTAHRDYDYEWLKFYGDSIIVFLVSLEVFLTKE